MQAFEVPELRPRRRVNGRKLNGRKLNGRWPAEPSGVESSLERCKALQGYGLSVTGATGVSGR